MAIWIDEWLPMSCDPGPHQPMVYHFWLNWDDDDDGRFHNVWSSYVVYPYAHQYAT